MIASDSMTSLMSSTSPAWSACTRVRVPGKVILSGEHAVVYGAPALACAIQKYAFVKITNSHLPGVHLKLPEFGIDRQFSHFQLSQLGRQTQFRHHQYLTVSGFLSNVVSNPVEFFAAALGASDLVDLLPSHHGLVIELTTDLAVGGGMGSSAAMVAAMLAAGFKHLGQPLSSAQLIYKTTQSEEWQHGHSSGLDPYVCVMGGLQQYQKGCGERQVIEHLSQYFLVTTGKPDSSTGECIDAVKRKNLPQALWHQFELIQENLLQCMLGGMREGMITAISANHRLLQHIGVVPDTVADFVAKIESKGGAAKVCGAGSVVGDHGGLVFVAGVEQNYIEQLCLSHSYDVQAMVPDLEGVFYFE